MLNLNVFIKTSRGTYTPGGRPVFSNSASVQFPYSQGNPTSVFTVVALLHQPYRLYRLILPTMNIKPTQNL